MRRRKCDQLGKSAMHEHETKRVEAVAEPFRACCNVDVVELGKAPQRGQNVLGHWRNGREAERHPPPHAALRAGRSWRAVHVNQSVGKLASVEPGLPDRRNHEFLRGSGRGAAPRDITERDAEPLGSFLSKRSFEAKRVVAPVWDPGRPHRAEVFGLNDEVADLRPTRDRARATPAALAVHRRQPERIFRPRPPAVPLVREHNESRERRWFAISHGGEYGGRSASPCDYCFPCLL